MGNPNIPVGISDLYQKLILQKRVYGENAGVLERVILQFISYNLL